MTDPIITRDQARMAYGEEFVRLIMQGKKEITLYPKQRILVEKWLLMRKFKFAPFAYEYVYMIENGRGEFKIGITRAPRKRLSGLRNGSTDELKIVGLIVVGGQVARNIERALHTDLKGKGIHVRGEWFSGKPEQWWPHIQDFARSRYADHITSLSAAWEGSEPLVGLYLAVHRGSHIAVDVVACREEFLWIVSQAEAGLTIAA